MTDGDELDGKSANGYRKPPAEHRFRKGVSGNPRGRPRKAPVLVATTLRGEPGIGFEDRVKSLAIREAYRPITVREGERTEKIPVIQAILRSVAVTAAKGNPQAQKMYMDLIGNAEADRREANAELLKTAIDYKERWGPILAQRARRGETGPELVPHPDDVIIDRNTGEVRIEGPVLEEQKRAQDQLHVMRTQLERDLMKTARELEIDPANPILLEQRRSITEIVNWIRADAAKRADRQGSKKPKRKGRN